MKKFNAKIIPALLVAIIFSLNLIAQETVVTVKVEKDGEVVKDTSYSFEDEAQAEHALKMMEMTEKHGGHSKTMIFISEDGETTGIKEIHGDSLVWIAEGEHEGDQMKVMKYRVEVGDDIHEEHGGEHVVIIKSDNDETFDIVIDEDCEGEDGEKKVVKKKVIKMTVESDDTHSDDTNKKSKKQ